MKRNFESLSASHDKRNSSQQIEALELREALQQPFETFTVSIYLGRLIRRCCGPVCGSVTQRQTDASLACQHDPQRQDNHEGARISGRCRRFDYFSTPLVLHGEDGTRSKIQRMSTDLVYRLDEAERHTVGIAAHVQHVAHWRTRAED